MVLRLQIGGFAILMFAVIEEDEMKLVEGVGGCRRGLRSLPYGLKVP